LHPNPRQPRKHFDDSALDELADSIRANGILQPILVRPRPTGGYEIVAGERRYRAALRSGLKQVPVVIRQLTDEETLAIALIENLVRENLSPLETARGFQRLMEDFGWTQEEMGKRVGKSRSAVANSLRLLRLPEEVQQALEAGEISEGHARTLIGDDTERQSSEFRAKQLWILTQIREQGLSVRAVEQLLRESRHTSTSPLVAGNVSHETRLVPSSSLMPSVSNGTLKGTPSLSQTGTTGTTGTSSGAKRLLEIESLEEQIRELLGTKVRISGNLERGKVEIEYFSAEQLEGLLEKLTDSSR
jgi:ParB family chromosome partitioning protein